MQKSNKPPLPLGLRTPLLYLLSLGLLLLTWSGASLLVSGTARQFLFPTPTAVAIRLARMISNGTLAYHAGVTLSEMGLGLLIGTSAALLLGYAVARIPWVGQLLEPLIVTSQAVPIVALAPLLTVWFGPGLASKVFVCALIVFFPILVNVAEGLRSIEPRQRDLFRLLEASPLDVLLKLEIPAALPALLTGLRVGGTLAGMGAVVGEFVASSKGLGYLVKQGQNLYDMPLMFVAIIALSMIALLVYGFLSLLERLTLRWRMEDTTLIH